VINFERMLWYAKKRLSPAGYRQFARAFPTFEFRERAGDHDILRQAASERNSDGNWKSFGEACRDAGIPTPEEEDRRLAKEFKAFVEQFVGVE
jgi:hypothetical protein